MTFQEPHLAFFLNCQPPKEWKGRNCREWAMRIDAKAAGKLNLPNVIHTRKTLGDLCGNPANSTEVCFFAIMAWGGMRYSHGREAYKHFSKFAPILEKVRSVNLTRAECFQLFTELRRKELLPNLRAPYFTKLIFFLHPYSKGYILDQWVGKSMNLLLGKPTPRLSYGGLVDDQTTSSHYEEFCRAVESLAGQSGKNDPAEVERRLLSKGGRNPHPWRKYVKDNWSRIHREPFK